MYLYIKSLSKSTLNTFLTQKTSEGNLQEIDQVFSLWIQLNTKISNSLPQNGGRLAEFLMFNSAFGRWRSRISNYQMITTFIIILMMLHHDGDDAYDVIGIKP